MKYKDYIIETKEDGVAKMYSKSSYDEAFTLLKEHCQKNLESKTILYRGMRYIGDYVVAEGENGSRKSIEGSNHYTKIIDEQLVKLNKNYPLRSKSAICATDKGHAETFGGGTSKSLYVVVPFDDVVVGVATRYDIWYTKVSIGNTKSIDLYNLNELWDEIGADDEFKDLESLAKYIEDTYNAMEAGDITEHTKFSIMFDGVKDIKQNVIDAYDIKKLGFDFIKFHEMNTDVGREVWFSGKAIMVREKLFDDIKNVLLDE